VLHSRLDLHAAVTRRAFSFHFSYGEVKQTNTEVVQSTAAFNTVLVIVIQFSQHEPFTPLFFVQVLYFSFLRW
jgi:hypothetical protein